MKYSPRPATFHVGWLSWKDGIPGKNLVTVANEADAHVKIAELFESGEDIRMVTLSKEVVYEVEQ